MSVDVVIPEIGESVTEGTITSWYVAVGDSVSVDQPLFELETDKITTDVPSPVAGTITELLAGDGEDVAVGAVVARLEAGDGPVVVAPVSAPKPRAADSVSPTQVAPVVSTVADALGPAGEDMPLPPATRRAIEEAGLDPADIQGTGRRGQILKGDVIAHVARSEQAALGATIASIPSVAPVATAGTPRSSAPGPVTTGAGRATRRVPMTRLRRRIAERLKEVQNTAAILTTFNEVDMKPMMDLRSRYKDAFLKKHDVKLGFMSFFAKAAIEALKDYPAVNGYIDGKDIVYNEFYDIGVAVSSPRGLVVPVVRDADRLSFAEVEKSIGDLARAARDGALTLDQLSGGTFTITNGGVFGSMLSTPIINAPQSAILGMHNIVQRPWVVDGEIVVRPIMYVALSYDHRIIDGAQAVRFLVRIKQLIEDPARLLLEI